MLSYVFQVFQGVILASRDRFMKNSPLGELPPFGGSVTSPEGYMLGLWVHECQRVFSDKMITLEDKAWVDGAIKELCKSTFAPDLTKQVSVAADKPLTLSLPPKGVMHSRSSATHQHRIHTAVHSMSLP